MTSRAKRRPTARAIDVVIEDKLWKNETAACRLVRRAALAALTAAEVSGKATIVLAGDQQVAALNAQFRGRKGPTNVLSFPSDEAGYLGDIAMSYGVVKREARAQGKTFASHAAHLAVHGVLHLLGHDHMKAHEAQAMELLETRIMASLGIADPYRARKAA